MEINGLDYNTQREPLMMPEYGREIQRMVDYAVTISDKQTRQQCAETIVKLMGTKVQQLRDNSDYERMLWDHLYLMSHKQLDIEWPYDVADAEKILTKPQPMKLPSQDGRVHLRHYGRLMEELFAHLMEMPEGPERDELVRMTANQMKRDLSTWGHGSADDERVAADLERFTEGKIRLDLNTFRFDKTSMMDDNDFQKRRRRK